jgi:hypothetical protein
MVTVQGQNVVRFQHLPVQNQFLAYLTLCGDPEFHKIPHQKLIRVIFASAECPALTCSVFEQGFESANISLYKARRSSAMYSWFGGYH